jgi:hypothetical protein
MAVYLLLPAVVLLLTCSTSSAAVVEWLAFNPEVADTNDQNKVLLFLWVQNGELETREAPQVTPLTVQWTTTGPRAVFVSGGTSGAAATPTDYNMKLSRKHPVAETALLDWDGTSATLNFSVCVYYSSYDRCKTAPGNLTLLWSVDAIEWQPLWNKTFVNLPEKRSSGLSATSGVMCPLKTVSVAMPVGVTTPRFAAKWVHRDLGERDSSTSDPCSVTLLDDITLPAQAPTAANIAYGRAALAPDATVESCSACTSLCNTGVHSSTGGHRRHR